MTLFYQIGHNWITFATLMIFLVTYAGIAVGHWCFLKLDRTGIALLGGIAMLAFGCIRLPQAVASVNMESILLLFALMVIASQLHYAGFYTWIAGTISGELLNRPALFLAVLIVSGGILSAFLNNDVVVLAVAPVITVSLLRKRMNPVPFLIALALASNIGCALTTIGSAQNVLIGQIGHLSFGRYMLFAAPPVLLSLAAEYVLVYWIGRNSFYLVPEPAADGTDSEPGMASDMPLNRWRTTKGLGILGLIVLLFVLTDLPHYLVAMTGAGLLLCSHMLPSKNVLRGVNWQLIVLFIGLFVVVGAFQNSGLSGDMMSILNHWGVNLNQPENLAVVSGILSNCINNSATVMLLVNVTDLSNPLNSYSLALSNAFAGNFFLLGSFANVIALQSAESFGLKISFREFARYGMPTSVLSMILLLIWIALHS